MGNGKRGVLVLFSFVLLVLLSFIATAVITPLSCRCEIKRDGVSLPTPIFDIGNEDCSVSCFNDDYRVNTQCKKKGTYTVDITCNTTAATQPCSATNYMQCNYTNYENLRSFPYQVPSPGCGQKEICFNGIDDDCSSEFGYDWNQTVNSNDAGPQGTYCACNNETLSLINPYTGLVEICVYDINKKPTDPNYYDWKDSSIINNYFKIYSIKAPKNPAYEIDVISDKDKWWVCGDTDLARVEEGYETAACRPNIGTIKVKKEELCTAPIPSEICQYYDSEYGGYYTCDCSNYDPYGYWCNVKTSSCSGAGPAPPQTTGSFPASAPIGIVSGVPGEVFLGSQWFNEGACSNENSAGTCTGGTKYVKYDFYNASTGYTCPLDENLDCDKSTSIPFCRVKGQFENQGEYNRIQFYDSFDPLLISGSTLKDTDGGGCSDITELESARDKNNPNDDYPCTDSDSVGSYVGSNTETCYSFNNDESCISEPSPEAEAENKNTVTLANGADIPSDYPFKDVSYSYICYKDGNDAAHVAECCSFGRCKNKESMGVNSSMPRAFGNGGTIRTLKNFDVWSLNGIKDGVEGRKFGADYTITMNSSLSAYSTLEFDLKMDYGVYDITIKVNNGPALRVADFVSIPFAKDSWRHVSIPISSFGASGSQSVISISGPRNAVISMDDFYLTMVNEPTYHCSEYFGEWIDSLDSPYPDDFNKSLPYKYACEAKTTFGWTGTKCCGNSQDDHYADSEAGCWKNYPVADGETVKDAVNVDSYNDLLYSDEGQSFYYCAFNGVNSKYSDGIVKNSQRCSAFNGINYVCDYGNKWSSQGVVTYPGIENNFMANNRTVYVNHLPTDFKDYNSLQKESCCPTGFCWNGTICIDGRKNAAETIPLSFIYNSSADFGYICSEGTWAKAEKKLSPHNEFFGYCWEKNQCYYKDSHGSEKCYNSGEFVKNDDDEILDYYCNGGNWSSRSKLLADEFNSLAKARYPSKPYTIFCDDPTFFGRLKNSELVNDIFVNFNEFAGFYYEGETRYSTCVLAVDDNDDGLFGSIGDKVIIGVPLKDSIEDVNLFMNDIDCDKSIGDSFEVCDVEEGTLYYNNHTKTIMFSQDSLESFSISKSFVNMYNWVAKFFKTLFTSENVSQAELEREGVIGFNNYINSSYSFQNNLYNHIYYYNSGTNPVKEIKSTIQYTKYGTSRKFIAYTNYIHFSLDFCRNESVNGEYQLFTPVAMTPGSDTEIHCNVKDTSVSQLIDPDDYAGFDDYWTDLTSKTRPKKAPYNPVTVEDS